MENYYYYGDTLNIFTAVNIWIKNKYSIVYGQVKKI